MPAAEWSPAEIEYLFEAWWSLGSLTPRPLKIVKIANALDRSVQAVADRLDYEWVEDVMCWLPPTTESPALPPWSPRKEEPARVH